MKKVTLILASIFALSSCDKLGLNNIFDKLMFWKNVYKEATEDEFVDRFMENANKYNILIKDTDSKIFVVSPGHDGKITNLEKLHVVVESLGKTKTTQDNTEHNNETSFTINLHADLKTNSGYSKQYEKRVGEYPGEYDAEFWIANSKQYMKEDGNITSEDYEGDFTDDFAAFLLDTVNSGALHSIASKTLCSFGAITYNGELVIPDSFDIKYELSKTKYKYSLEYSITQEVDEYEIITEYKETLEGGNFLVDECTISSKTETHSYVSDYAAVSTQNLHYVIDNNIKIPNIG